MANGNSSLPNKQEHDNPSLRELIEVQDYFGLPTPALVEKDWYVVKALAAISSAATSPFRLVFGGGTALSRAHRLIRRMSEDIDLKIVQSRSRRRRDRDPWRVEFSQILSWRYVAAYWILVAGKNVGFSLNPRG